MAPTANRYRWVIEATLLPLNAAIPLNFLAPTPVFSLIMEEYGLNRGTVSLLVAVVAVVFTVFLVPGGLIVARLGPRKAIAIGGVLAAVGMLTPLAPSFWTVMVLRLVFGVGASIIFPAISGAVVQWFPKKELPIINGLNLAGQTAGVSLGLFLSVPLAEAVGWQSVFFIYGALGLGATLAWLLLGRDANAASGQAGQSPPLGEVLRSLRERAPLLLAFATIGPNAVFLGFSSWLPSYYHEARGISLTQAGALVGLMFLVGVVANPLSGVLQARVGLRRPFLALAGVVSPLAALGLVFFESPILIAIAALLLGTCSSLFLTALFTIPMELPGVTQERVPVITAGILTMGNVTTILAPLFVGAMTDALGSYVPSLTILAFCPLTMLIAAIFLPETGPRGALAQGRAKTARWWQFGSG